MPLTDFLTDFARLYGDEALEGAIVLVDLDRATDRAIRWAMRLDARHHGATHRWSHTFLIAEPWRGRGTAILDMTIRDSDGNVDWKTDLKELMSDFARGMAGRAGGVYVGSVADYDAAGTLDFGVKWIPGLSAEQRIAIVAQGHRLRSDGYHYDLPGLFREFVQFTLGIELPAGERMLFCSAFVQDCYREALREAGDFAESRPVKSTTPDDLWYSMLGANFPALPPGAPLTRAIPALVGRLSGLEGAIVSRLSALSTSGQGYGDDESLLLGQLLARVRDGGDDPPALGSRAPSADDMLRALVGLWAGHCNRRRSAHPA